MKIYYLNPLSTLTDGQLGKLQALGDFTIIETTALSLNQIMEKIRDVDILMCGSSAIKHFSKNIIDQLPALKFVSLTCVGTDWIDLEEAKKRHVLISTARGANTESVAEHAWGMILDLSKRITEADRDIRAKDMYSYSDYLGHEVYGKTIGIIGFGHIGKRVSQIAKAFEMRVMAYDIFQSYYPNIKWVKLDQLCQESDVIIVSVSLTEETKNMIGYKQFYLMKKQVLLVNIAREQIVNKEAVIEALTSGKVGGYGLEAPISEIIPHDDPYLSLPNVVITPHTAFNTAESNKRTIDMAINNIKAYIDQLPENLIY